MVLPYILLYFKIQAPTINLRFPGQYFDVKTGHHYNTNRDYNPVTGRCMQSDPIKEVLEDFNKLPVSNVTIRHEHGKTLYIGRLDDGRTVIARNGSGKGSGDVPTLEIQKKNLTIKIRYMPKLPFSDEGLGTGLGPIDTMVGAAIDGLF